MREFPGLDIMAGCSWVLIAFLLIRQAFVEFLTPQAATAAKHKIEALGAQQPNRKYIVTYTQAHTNPFRTLPKDNPMRGKDGGNRSGSGFNSPGGQGGNFGNTGGYRGGRGGFNRGGMNMGFNNRNFNSPMGGGAGFQPNPMAAGFTGAPMAGTMPYGGGFNARGGMMGPNMRGGPNIRGGRGGMAGPMPTNMMPMGGVGGPMGGMGMGAMGMGAMPNQLGGMMGAGMPGNMGMQGMLSFSLDFRSDYTDRKVNRRLPKPESPLQPSVLWSAWW